MAKPQDSRSSEHARQRLWWTERRPAMDVFGDTPFLKAEVTRVAQVHMKQAQRDTTPGHREKVHGKPGRAAWRGASPAGMVTSAARAAVSACPAVWVAQSAVPAHSIWRTSWPQKPPGWGK